MLQKNDAMLFIHMPMNNVFQFKQKVSHSHGLAWGILLHVYYLKLKTTFKTRQVSDFKNVKLTFYMPHLQREKGCVIPVN